MKTKKLGVGVLLFILCLSISGYITYLIKERAYESTVAIEEPIINANADEINEESSNNTSDESTIQAKTSQMESDHVVEAEKSQNAIRIMTSKVIGSEDNYAFTASHTGTAEEACHYELWGKSLIQTSDDGAFHNVPATPTGKYKLYLCGNETKRRIAEIVVRGFNPVSISTQSSTPEPTQKKLITEEEFKSKMLNPGDHSLDNTYPRKKKDVYLKDGFRIITVDANEDDKINLPSDIQDIKDRIRMGNWKTVELIGLEYDEKGYVNVVKVKPVY